MSGGGGRWVTVRVDVGQEFSAEAALVKRGFRVFMPWMLRVWMMNKRAMCEKIAVFKGYLFLEIKGQRPVHRAKNTDGVIDIISYDGRVAFIDYQIICDLMRKCEHDGYWPRGNTMPCDEESIKPGDIVMAYHGPFSGMLGRVERVDSGKSVFLNLSVFGRSTLVECPIGAVSPSDGSDMC